MTRTDDDLAPSRPPAGPAGRLVGLTQRAPVGRVGLVIAVVVVLLGVAGYAEDQTGSPSLLDLDGEGKPPAAFSALLLAGAGLACFLCRGVDGARRRWAVLGGFFLFMALDESLTLHETASEITGVAWTVLYAPVVLFGGIAWLLVLQRLHVRGARGPRAAWLLGAVAWATAVVLEEVQSGPETGRVAAYSELATAEECLEMTGNALWLLALAAAYQVWSARRSAQITQT